jgi:protein-disulfide isomerase
VQLIKWEQKYGRQNGIHASPTFLVNGLVVGQASSGWTLEQWRELLDPLLA